MFICHDCGGYFTSPDVDASGFEHAFGFTATHVPVCPYCESPDFEEADICPVCGEARKFHDDILCPVCRHELHSRVMEFFDTFTEDEERQFDAWMEDNSIADRGGFIAYGKV